MPKRLTTSLIRALKVGTRASDGDGLYIENDKAVRYFGWRYAIGGKYHELRLGRWQDESGHEGITLTDARARVADLWGGLAKGIDPKASEPVSKVVHSFRDVSDRFVEAIIVPTGKHNGEHASQWNRSLKDHCKPITDMDVAQIGVEDVLACLHPIGLTKTPTASRVRGRIERILSYVKARDWRTGENLAIWTIPAEHEKTTQTHRVPLSDRAMAILRCIRPPDIALDDVVFASNRHRKLTRGHETLYWKMQRIAPGLTVHGMRATFSTWARETGRSTEAKELALSHRAGNNVGRLIWASS